MICDHCQEPAMACAPGTEAIHDLFLLRRGQPLRCWCLCHWTKAFTTIREEENHNEPMDKRDAAQ